MASPKHWPGSSSTKALLTGSPIEGLWFDRTQEHKAREQGKRFGKFDFAEEENLVLSPLPCWDAETGQAIQAKIRALVKSIEAEVDERVRKGGSAPMGAKAVLAQRPHDQPLESKRSPAPRFHAKSGEVRRNLERAYQRFYWSYREAATKLREGLVDVVFPPGSFPPPASFVTPHPASGFG